ncbi:hypothetical protein SDC9_158875 [bioreactor metagenome]|uniref:Uncharacterized protein n=1 Tax=bioreactor metagenome TaxID=1076179 RepID=A0A645FDP0_9ZZZZ
MGYVHFAKYGALVHNAYGISHGSVGISRYEPQSIVISFNIFFLTYIFQSIHNIILNEALEIKSLASGQYSSGQFVRLCCCQYKFYIGRRLLQGFQQCIEGFIGEHMHLVNYIYLVLAQSGSKLYRFP